MIRLGPITIMRTSTRDAYRELANAAYHLHERIWFTDNLCPDAAQEAIRELDTSLAGALSYTPPDDIT